MNLLQLRTQLIKISGRYDLVVDNVDFADNGANFYIQQGQNYLDRKLNIGKTWGRLFIDLDIGDFKVEFQNCRAIKEVWIMDSTSRLKLTQVSMADLRGTDAKTGTNNFVEPFAEITKSKPKYFCPAKLRRVPESEDGSGDSDTIKAYLDTISPYDSTYNGVIFLPPADETYSLEVIGLFYSELLSDNTDNNIWTDVYPNLLIMSAMRQMEIMYRNTEGVRDWTLALDAELVDLEKDAIEQEINDVTKLEG